MIKSLPERLKTHRSSLAGLPFVIAGIAMITYLLYTQYLYRPTREVLLAGLLINVLIGTGLTLIYTDVIHSSYIPVDGAASEPFDQWKSQWKRNQKVLLITGGVLLAMALFNFNSMLTGNRYKRDKTVCCRFPGQDNFRMQEKSIYSGQPPLQAMESRRYANNNR